MASRPQGYGMTAELERKKLDRYDLELEEQARMWIEAVINKKISEEKTPLGMDNFHEALKDGNHLCTLINVLRPGSVKKINTSKMAFKMMENIGNFLEAISQYGVPKSDQFQTVDLYENQNMGAVVNCIHALGRCAQKNGYSGPTLGVKEADANRREFSAEQLNAGKNVIGLQMGSNKGASQAGQNFGKTRMIID